MSVEVGSAFLTVMPSASGFGRKLEGQLGRETGQTGDKVGGKVSQGITRSLGRANFRSTGQKIGTSLVQGLAKNVAGRVLERTGQKIGDKLFDKASERLKKVPWKRALSNPAIGAGAVAAGLFVARKFTKAANDKINSGFKPNIAEKLKGNLKGGLKGGIAGLAAGLIGGGIFGAAKSFAMATSDMNETVSKMQNVFGKGARSIRKWAEDSADSLGLSTQAALEGASSFGNLFDQLGFGARQSVKMSKGFVQMASDAASFNNADPSEVMDAFLSATRGEYDALQRYIPTASAATIETEALRQTHKKSAKDLTAADKAAALYSVAVRDLGKAHGDFKRTGGGFANLLRSFAAHWANLKVKIGEFFLPALVRATKYMNTEGFPALSRMATAMLPIANAARKMGAAVLASFSTSFGSAIDKATLSLSEIADWMETHQESMVRFFIGLGDKAFALGRAITATAIAGVHGFANMQRGLADFIQSGGNGLASFLEGLAKLPFLSDEAKASFTNAAASIRTGSDQAATSLRHGATSADTLAKAIGDKVYPSLTKAQGAMHRVGNEQIFKARQRDAAARFALAVRDIGNKSDVAKNKLHGYNIESGKGTNAQRAFGARVRTARDELIKKYKAYSEAGVRGKAFKKVVDRSRDALYREFKQMGFSRKEAQELAKKYSKVPKKIETKTTTPGMKQARKHTKDLDDKINGLNNRTVKIMVALGKQGFSRKGLQETVDRRVATGGRLASGGRLHGPGTGTSDSILGVDPRTRKAIAHVSTGEWVINAKMSEKYDALLSDINRDKLASGGKVGRKIVANTHGLPKSAQAIPGQVNAVADAMAVKTWKAYQKALEGVVGAGHGSKKRVRWHGGTFTERFANTLKTAQRLDGSYFPVIQGGFRPRTSYSGSSHAGDAVDTRWDPSRLRAMHRAGVYAWHRTPAQGPWGHHIHGIPKKGFGYPAGSGKWQQGDAARGGNGLARGSQSTTRGVHWVGEDGPELHATKTGDKVYSSRDSAASAGRGVTVHLDLGDGLTRRIQGVLDENDQFKASIGKG